MNYKKLILLALCFLIVLVIVDLVTGIFFWNRINLEFDSSVFNNIATPIIGIVAVTVYSAALYVSYLQNQIIQSQHLKPYFEKELTKYENHLKATKFDIDLINSEYEECNGINFTSVITEQLVALSKDIEFEEDIEKNERGIPLSRNYVMSRTYIGIVHFLSQFSIKAEIKLRYNYLLEFADEVDNSKLLPIDKEQIKRRVRQEFIGQYLSFVESEKKHKNMVPPFPNVYDYNSIHRENLKFVTLSETSFSDVSQLLKEKYD